MLWVYYKNGRNLTGWNQINGKWYDLYAKGSMAVNTKFDGYKIKVDGTRIES